MNNGMETQTVEESVEYALRYAEAGLSVLPIACDGTKKPPPGQVWKPLQSNIASEAEIRRMFAGQKGIAVVCGKVSGNLETLDIDAPELVEPFESAVRELAPDLLERLPTVASPRDNWGGRHYRYRLEGDVAGSTKLAQSELRPQFKDDGTPDIDERTGAQRMAPDTLIETRGEGGYAIAPGSPPECHETGLPYKHISGPPLTEIPKISAEEHRILWHVAKSFNRYVDEKEVKDLSPAQRAGDSPGDAFNASATWDEILLPAGWSKDRAIGNITQWRRPGKAKGISATTGVRSSNGTDLFCVFSSNAHPFAGPTNGRVCSSYSKFAAYATLHHNGDFAAAARDLKAKGHGKSTPSSRLATKPIRPISPPESFRPFPTNLLPLACSEYVWQAARSIDCDESMVALPLLAGLAAAIGNTCRIQLKRDYSEPAIIWAAVVSESGSRKSAAVESPLRTLKRREAEQIKSFKDQMKKYENLLQEFRASKKRKKDQSDGNLSSLPPEIPVCQRYTVSDVTAEALAVRLEQNPRGLLQVRDELAGFFSAMNQYKSGGKGGDEAAYLAMHGGRPLVIDRKSPDKPQIFVPQASLSIVGGIQPGVLRRAFTPDRMESGMAARFLMTYPPPRTVRWSEKAIDVEVEEQLAALFDRLLFLVMRFDIATNEPIPHMLTLTPEAKTLWIAFHDEHAVEQAELSGELSAAWAKLTGYAARLSLICEMASWAPGVDLQPPTEISATSMEAGIAMARWFAAETKRIYAVLNENDDERGVRELVDYIRSRGGKISARDLTRGPRRFRDDVEYAEAEIENLAKLKFGDWIPQGSGSTGGRPTWIFQLREASTGDKTSAFSA